MPRDRDSISLYVSGFKDNTRPSDLATLFEPHGRIVDGATVSRPWNANSDKLYLEQTTTPEHQEDSLTFSTENQG
ncbi:hypothetical protein BGX26_000475 [Mortierella sp. AD094]|nr:hypothetical protein BGX26_000475 [Mortierella sp. AD094]